MVKVVLVVVMELNDGHRTNNPLKELLSEKLKVMVVTFSQHFLPVLNLKFSSTLL